MPASRIIRVKVCDWTDDDDEATENIRLFIGRFVTGRPVADAVIEALRDGIYDDIGRVYLLAEAKDDEV